jgi:hypothetical protein
MSASFKVTQLSIIGFGRHGIVRGFNSAPNGTVDIRGMELMILREEIVI